MAQTAETAGVFISYRQADSKAWAVLLRDDLVEQFGPEPIFLDRDSLHAGSWREQIEHNLRDCSVTLLVIGRGWLDVRNAQGRRLDQPDDVHRNEIAHALQRPGMTLIPVLVDDAQLPPPEALPAELRALAECQARRLSDQAAHREVDVRALADDIERLSGLRRRAVPGTGPAAAAEPQNLHLPFLLDDAAARMAFDAWKRGLLMAPGDFAAKAVIEQLGPVWVPHWRAHASATALWQGRRGDPRKPVQGAAAAPAPAAGDNTDWQDVQGETKALFNDLVLRANAGPEGLGGDAPELLAGPSLPRLQQAPVLPMADVPVLPTTLQESAALSEATTQVRAEMERRAKQQIGGSRQELVHLDLQVDGLRLQPVMAPAFAGQYRYGDKLWPLWISADTGAVGGASPTSGTKVTAVVVAVLLVLGLVAWWFFKK